MLHRSVKVPDVDSTRDMKIFYEWKMDTFNDCCLAPYKRHMYVSNLTKYCMSHFYTLLKN